LLEAPIADYRGGAVAPPLASFRAHLVGAHGAGMRSLAEVLAAAGCPLSGSDLAGEAGSLAPLDVAPRHDADLVDPACDVVVYSAAIPRSNPELARARQLGIETISYPQMLGRLMQSRHGVAVAGTHGKSTTTAMTGDILIAAGLDPSVIVGAAPIGYHTGGRLGLGRSLVVEACEYRAGFQHLRPDLAAILNIEPDHFDCFATQAELESAFRQFAGSLPSEGVLLVRADCAATRRATAALECNIESFGFLPSADWRAEQLESRRGYYGFRVLYRDEAVCDVKLPVPGRHNVLNALAAAALASHSGADGESIRRGLE
jgi:UDP-N-acetylmuramate--alanine ligase